MAAPDESRPACTVAVRTLCDFTARRGDLDLRFTPSPTAQQGIAGHQWVVGRRGAGYEAEIALQGRWQDLAVRGRADGFDPARGQLEEIKTHRGDLSRQSAHQRHLHWAQLKVYGWLMCEARGLASLRLALVYLDLDTHTETVFTEEHDAPALRAFFEDRCRDYIDWARQEAAHRQARDAACSVLRFPHEDFRPGQRPLAETVWRAATRGRCLMAQAPTGIGKTIATLFPLLRAAPAQSLDRIFFLTAKTQGRQLALDALQRLREAHGAALAHPAPSEGAAPAAAPAHQALAQRAPQALPLRVLELTAREKACEHPDKACHGESCPLARGFYDRLPAARAQAVEAQALDAPALRALALAHEVCPYWLAQDLARWCDVVVGDYHHFLDTSALLHALTLEQEWRCAVLLDEAHNVLDRTRAMYSAQLEEAALGALRKAAPAALKRPLERLARTWREQVRALDAIDAEDPTRQALPQRLVLSLQQAAAAIAEHLATTPQAPDAALQQLHFDLLAFTRLAETFGDHSLFDILRSPGPRRPTTTLSIRNLLPAPHLAPRWKAAHSAVLFSATLGSAGFCRDTLGLPADTAWVEVDSPFSADQLQVRLVPGISTRWSGRERSLAPIADLIARQWHERPGNYLAFFSSYDYLQAVSRQLAQAHPQVPQWSQSPGMSEAQRSAFLARFEPGGSGVGFAVLGGGFGEGIDLPGDRLVGAFIATLGLPQVNDFNERLRQRLQQAFGAGFDYAYLYPGLRKVVQAAGRVIRTPEDRGVVYLVDDRFCRAEVRALLPAWWQPVVWPVAPESPGR